MPCYRISVKAVHPLNFIRRPRFTVVRIQRFMPIHFMVEDLAQIALIDELPAVGAGVEIVSRAGSLPCRLPGIGGPRSDNLVIL